MIGKFKHTMFHFRNNALKARGGERPLSKGPRPTDAPLAFYSGATVKRQIALTFDDGPSEWTADLLDLLESSGAKATFFVMGAAIAGREDVLRRAIAEGHELGNHLYSHADSRQLSKQDIHREIEMTAEQLAAIGCGEPTLIRPPYGTDVMRVSRLSRGLGYGPTALWSIDPRDWCSERDAIANAVIDQAHPGGIVLLHDGNAESAPGQAARGETVRAVQKLLVALGEDGYSFVTVSEILL